MKKILLGILFLCCLSSCYQAERNCKDFKTGTFEFESYLEGELVKTRFLRTDSIEIDYFRGQVDTSSIRWINDCEYILSNLNPKNRAEEKPIHMKILTTKNNTYTFEYGLVGETQKQRGTVVKVE
ncbi:DNA topoisomerase IV [Salinimicrobium sp. MT39]|uniref:DNA topoisomerase IV n=1 Tax=Salinimicrobium profundisediminis TaxID=2994553 RepID=A0A9X3CV50_9FLAO|nr:DNA topoisomerase IV [Salinimicrobium profundisediminis]MCX2837416.1 DNA topoisomerase IV [Salinimicrobium profundisediminis]